MPADVVATFSVLAAIQPAGFVSQITCSGPIGASDLVAIVYLHAAVVGSGPVVLRDYANPATPRSVCTFRSDVTGNYAVPVQLIDARHAVISSGTLGRFAVVDLPTVRYHWFQLPQKAITYPELLAVGPALDQVLWLTRDQASGTDRVHVTTSAGDHVVASLPDPNLGTRCGSPEDSKQGAYTHSGAHLFVLDQPYPAFNTLAVVAGERAALRVAPPSGGSGWP